LPELFISLQLAMPMQAHLCSPLGVSKRLKLSRAKERGGNPAITMVRVRRVARIASPAFSPLEFAQMFRPSFVGRNNDFEVGFSSRIWVEASSCGPMAASRSGKGKPTRLCHENENKQRRAQGDPGGCSAP
jgi:hypothetical protein